MSYEQRSNDEYLTVVNDAGQPIVTFLGTPGAELNADVVRRNYQASNPGRSYKVLRLRVTGIQAPIGG